MGVYKEQNFKTNLFVVKFHFSGVVPRLSPFSSIEIRFVCFSL